MPGTVSLHRVFAAKPEKLYRAFLEPDAVSSWLFPFGFTCTVHELEAKEGGKHRISFRNFTTSDSHFFGGTYLKLVPGDVLAAEVNVGLWLQWSSLAMAWLMVR